MDLRCIGLKSCGLCMPLCPNQAITPGACSFSQAQQTDIQTIQLDRSKCTDCGLCTDTCYSKSLFISGTDYTIEEIVERIRRDEDFFKSSGEGGVTISGGEPLCQAAFTIGILKACREIGIHTAVDTTGYADTAVIEKVLPFTDLFLYDLKHMESLPHKKVIGVPNEIILKNAKHIARSGGKLQIRIPIIPGFNDSPENMDETARFCAALGKSVTVVQLLPFHRMGSVKYQRLQQEDPMPSTDPPTAEAMQEHLKHFTALDLNVVIH
jgi:pyruvate formate lyase activating enzyme